MIVRRKKQEMEILIKDLRTKNISKFVYTDEEVYKKMLINFRRFEKEGKCEIIPQDINYFIKTGIKV